MSGKMEMSQYKWWVVFILKLLFCILLLELLNKNAFPKHLSHVKPKQNHIEKNLVFFSSLSIHTYKYVFPFAISFCHLGLNLLLSSVYTYTITIFPPLSR